MTFQQNKTIPALGENDVSTSAAQFVLFLVAVGMHTIILMFICSYTCFGLKISNRTVYEANDVVESDTETLDGIGDSDADDNPFEIWIFYHCWDKCCICRRCLCYTGWNQKHNLSLRFLTFVMILFMINHVVLFVCIADPDAPNRWQLLQHIVLILSTYITFGYSQAFVKYHVDHDWNVDKPDVIAYFVVCVFIFMHVMQISITLCDIVNTSLELIIAMSISILLVVGNIVYLLYSYCVYRKSLQYSKLFSGYFHNNDYGTSDTEYL